MKYFKKLKSKLAVMMLVSINIIPLITWACPPPMVMSFNPPSGYEGDPLIIDGSGFSNFQGTGWVMIDATPVLTYNFWNDTQISVNVPAGATTGMITVTIDCGNTGSSAGSFTVLSPVHNLSKGQDYATLAAAVAAASNGNYIQIDAGVYNEPINLSRFTNLTLEATEWATNGVNTNTFIIGNGINPVIALSNTFGCRIIGFTIGNGSYGIFSSASSPNSNTIANNIITNVIVGVGITNGDYNTVTNNFISRCVHGVLITGTSVSNNIINNIVCSNITNGIYISGVDADNNVIQLNDIFQNAENGIDINSGDDTIIVRNRIYDNILDGIASTGAGSVNTYIVHNTIVSNGSDAIDVTAPDTAVITNNISLGHVGYAINNSGAGGSVTADYNLSYNDISGLVNGFAHGPSSWTTDPLLNPTTDTLTALSDAVDNGTITVYSIPFNGTGPDLGWYESTLSSGPQNVHNVTRDIWYNTITDALTEASNGNVINVYPNTYNEVVTIGNFTNLTLQAFDWTNKGINTNTIIIGNGASDGVRIQNSQNVLLQGFTVLSRNTATGYGIYLNNSSGSRVMNNNTFSNWAGVAMLQAVNNTVSNNLISISTTPGVYIQNSSTNTVVDNDILNSGNSGIQLNSFSLGNRILGNNIATNNVNGIWLMGSGNVVNDNTIWANNQYGINILNADINWFTNNNIFGNGTGIYINNSDDITIYSNVISQNAATGILASNTTNIRILKNWIPGNAANGIRIPVGLLPTGYLIADKTITGSTNGMFLHSITYSTVVNNYCLTNI